MMSNNNMLGGPREASQTTPQPNTTSVNQLIQIELEGLTLRNVALGLAIYVAISIVLFIVGTQSVATLYQWLWLSAVSCTGLSIWLWLANAKRAGNLSPSSTQIAIYSSAVICAALWGAASPLFIQAGQLEATALVMIILITLSFPWLLLFHYRRFFQQVVLSLIYVPLLATLYIKYPQQPAFLALIVVVYGLLTVCAMASHGRARGITASMLKSKEQARKTVQTSQKIASLIEQTPLGFIEWNQQREIITWNPAATTIFGYSRQEVLGRTTDFLFDNKKPFLMQQVENDLFLFGKDFSGTAENITRDGTVIICEWNDTPLFDEAMNVVGAASFVEDVTDRVNLETRIKQQAYFDPLTGLPNRHRLMEELNRVIALAQRNKHYCSLLFIDLDHFKEINDTRGHHYGDIALTLFAQRLRKVIRTEETVARLGGDEFVVLLENLEREEESSRLQVAQVAEKIIDAAREPFLIKEEKFRISCSIGIVLFNDGSADGGAILQQADKALYAIKREGKSNYYFHNQRLPSELQAHTTLLAQLRDKANTESFFPYYQPIIDTSSNLICGLQIFLRWRNPDNQIIPANDIIQILESGSMIVEISLSLLDQCCRQLTLWRDQGLWRNDQKIYFTLSLRELEHPSFVTNVQNLLNRHNISAETLVFSLHTETLPKIYKPLELQINKLNDLGIGFSVDNVGYQSLPIQKLRDFDISTIRISQRLMAESVYMESSWNLVKGLIDLAKSVGLTCIAPGIEEPEIHHLVLDTGCPLLQGNLIAPPSPATSITRMLIERNVRSEQESVT